MEVDDSSYSSPSYAVGDYTARSDEDFKYPMKRRGLALIINNSTFKDFTNNETSATRSGSEKDVEGLAAALKCIGFHSVLIKKDQPVEEMCKTIQYVVDQDHSDKDCLFIALMSHGSPDHIRGSDNKLISYDRLLEPLMGDRDDLAGKPKIILVQACQGSKHDKGMKFQADTFPPCHGLTHSPIPSFIGSDCLYSCSSVPGYASFRDVQKGSWFIQSLATVLKADWKRLEFSNLLTRVNHMVSYSYQTTSDHSTYPSGKQSPFFYSTLTKELWFD